MKNLAKKKLTKKKPFFSIITVVKNDEQNIIKLKMDKLFKESNQLDFHVASELIGGVKLRVDNLLIDGSIQGQLKRLKDQIN